METDTNSCRSEIVPVSCKYPLTKRNVLNLCVNVFSTKVVIGDTIFASSTGLQFYAVIRTTQRSCRWQRKGSTFIFHYFKTLSIGPSSGIDRTRDLPLCSQAINPTEPILLLNKSFTHVEPRLAYKVWCACSHCTKECHRNPIRYVTTRFSNQRAAAAAASLRYRNCTEIIVLLYV